jgi:hypothetical protein
MQRDFFGLKETKTERLSTPMHEESKKATSIYHI